MLLTHDNSQCNNKSVLIEKLEKIGTPLGQHWNVYTGSIKIGKSSPFVINDSKLQQLITKCVKRGEIVENVLLRSQQKWRTEPANLITILSSSIRQYPWSSTNEEIKAERIFQVTYPAVCKHINPFKEKLKAKYKSDRGKFWWELKSTSFFLTLHQPKIVYPSIPGVGQPMQAAFDNVGIPTQDYLHSIIPADLHLLAFLNSTLFNWYAKVKFNKSNKKMSLNLCKQNIVTVPIAKATIQQKVNLSLFAHKIITDPDSPDVPDLEEEINQLVYKLYDLTPAEIKLIEKETAK